MVISGMIIKAQNFSRRGDLELEFTRLGIEFSPDMKPHEIVGTREELERLNLSDRTKFHGVKCVITNTPTQVKTQTDVLKPQRGEIKEFGINGITKKPK